MRLRKTPLALGVLAAAVLSSGAAYAVVTTAHTTKDSPATVDLSVSASSGPAIFLEADLSGRSEAYRAGMAAGDPRGSAREILRIKGNELTFAITWSNMSAPNAMHVMTGMSNAAGPVFIPLVTGALPGNINTVEGMVTVPNLRLLNLLLTAPDHYYGNLFNNEYPRGAVRGQFRRIGPVDFNAILHTGMLEAVGSGDQEVPNNGDLNAHTVTTVGAAGATLNFATMWSGVNSPFADNINRGAVGMNGDLVANLFTAPRGLSAAIFAVAGTVGRVPAAVIAEMKANPANFHTNLLTGRFPAGAARGQVFALMMTPTTTMPTMPTTTMPTTTTTKPTTTSTATMPSTNPAMGPTVTTTGSIPTNPGGHW